MRFYTMQKRCENSSITNRYCVNDTTDANLKMIESVLFSMEVKISNASTSEVRSVLTNTLDPKLLDLTVAGQIRVTGQ